MLNCQMGPYIEGLRRRLQVNAPLLADFVEGLGNGPGDAVDAKFEFALDLQHARQHGCAGEHGSRAGPRPGRVSRPAAATRYSGATLPSPISCSSFLLVFK